jgi:antitoxin PrlF
MDQATLTSKGQLTVPKGVRERLGLSPGDKLLFEVEDEAIRLRVLKRKSLEELRGSLPATRSYPGKEAEREAARRSVARKVLGENA